jgi:hypothetical protein
MLPVTRPEHSVVRRRRYRSPEPLKNRIVQDSLWGAEISLQFCRRFGNLDRRCLVLGCGVHCGLNAETYSHSLKMPDF